MCNFWRRSLAVEFGTLVAFSTMVLPSTSRACEGSLPRLLATCFFTMDCSAGFWKARRALAPSGCHPARGLVVGIVVRGSRKQKRVP